MRLLLAAARHVGADLAFLEDVETTLSSGAVTPMVTPTVAAKPVTHEAVA